MGGSPNDETGRSETIMDVRKTMFFISSSNAASDFNRTMKEQVESNEDKEYDCDNAIHGEKGGVEFTQIIRRDQGVLISQQNKHGADPEHRECAQAKCPDQSGKQK
jgi:hypothetical protein